MWTGGAFGLLSHFTSGHKRSAGTWCPDYTYFLNLRFTYHVLHRHKTKKQHFAFCTCSLDTKGGNETHFLCNFYSWKRSSNPIRVRVIHSCFLISRKAETVWGISLPCNLSSFLWQLLHHNNLKGLFWIVLQECLWLNTLIKHSCNNGSNNNFFTTNILGGGEFHIKVMFKAFYLQRIIFIVAC